MQRYVNPNIRGKNIQKKYDKISQTVKREPLQMKDTKLKRIF